MDTNAQFLAAVAATPDDHTLRLVYADWLDEQDDPRGELIRLEEEASGRVAWDDTLWRLKPRRNELRQRVDPAWLLAMRYGTDCEPLFRGQPFPPSWRDAWRLIREAHERWTGESIPDTGGHAPVIEAVERRLGRILPPSVREYVAFANDINCNRNSGLERFCVYRDPYTLTPVPGHPALSLILQSEGDVHWAVRYEDLHLEDPPVYMYHWGDSEDVFVQPEELPSPSVSRFLFEYADSYSAHHHAMLDVGVQDVEQARAQLREAFPFCARLEGVEMYEMTNISAQLVTPDRYDPGRLRVSISRPVAREEIPKFLWGCCSGGGSFTGLFATEALRLRPNHQPPQQVPGGEDPPIPF